MARFLLRGLSPAAGWAEEGRLLEGWMEELFARNRAWAQKRIEADPDFFARLSRQQAPRYFWLGCSDSRVPATEILGLDPGSVFVHRNIANLAQHTDLNFLAVLQFAVEYLKVEHIIVTGHYGCGGVRAALGTRQLGLVDYWLRSLRDIHERYQNLLEDAPSPEAREDLLVELNVETQVMNVARTPIVQNAWARGQSLTVHGWIYGVQDGILRDLGYKVSRTEEIGEPHQFWPLR
jgi:carbonic anhydrase